MRPSAIHLLSTFAGIFLLALAINACASGGGAIAGSHDRCGAQAADSIYKSYAPVYRQCAVDRAAKVASAVNPTFTPSGPAQSCYTAELEFVVDTTGNVMRGSVHVVRSTDDGFAQAVTEKTSTWSFDPAVLAGAKVRQIFDYKATLQTVRGATGRTGRAPTSGGISHDMDHC